jgi:hypothetical protein
VLVVGGFPNQEIWVLCRWDGVLKAAKWLSLAVMLQCCLRVTAVAARLVTAAAAEVAPRRAPMLWEMSRT